MMNNNLMFDESQVGISTVWLWCSSKLQATSIWKSCIFCELLTLSTHI